jgi:hypothetical protein
MKVKLEGDDFAPHLYDRDNGPGAAAGVVANLRANETEAHQSRTAAP